MTTPQEMQAAVSKALLEAEKQLLPAKLKVTQENANAVIGEITRLYGVGSPAIYNSETYYAAFKSLYRTLDWEIPPAKLVAQRQNESIATAPSAIESENAWAAKVKAADAREAKKAADVASIARAKQLIAQYNPTSRNGYDARERMDAQASWGAALDRAIAEKVNLRDWVEILAAAIQKRYRDREKASEKM